MRFDEDENSGSEQSGHRPAVIISSDGANSRLPVVTIAAITRTIRDENSPIALLLPEGFPLDSKSSIMAFQVRTIDKSRLEKLAGSLSSQQILQLNQKLRNAWDL